MTTDQILRTFDPLLTSALERFQRFQNPEPRDITKIFGPTFAAVCRAAGVDDARATMLVDSWSPAAITSEGLHSAVRELTAPTMSDMADARAKQEALEAELARDAAAHPLTERDRVLLARKQPLAQRSRQSIQDELNEANTGRMSDGTELPHLDQRHWDALAPHYAALEREIEERDCALAGIPYSGPPVKRDQTLDMVHPMRG